MKYLIQLLLLVTLVACRSPQEQSAAPENIFSSDIPEDFLNFYMRFHSDSLFQKEHIVFPLKMKTDSSFWEASEWVLHKPFNDQNGEFSQTFLTMGGRLIVEHIESSNKVYKMERRFSKSKNSYNLIYYKVDNAFRNSDEWEKDN